MPRTCQNPVYPEAMADPFVLKHEGVYYAYGTAPAGPDGRQVPLLRSRDLVDWELLGHALQPDGDREYWAPEVACHEGRFYMYYSSGSAPEGTDQRLRVALASDPAGPFVDTGSLLVPGQPFSIDAHPFRHVDGQWYLFYCVDFLDASGERPPGAVIGPGHNCFATSPDGSETWIVYHAWDVARTARRMCIDRLGWEGGRPVTAGPSCAPQPAPSTVAQ